MCSRSQKADAGRDLSSSLQVPLFPGLHRNLDSPRRYEAGPGGGDAAISGKDGKRVQKTFSWTLEED